MLMLWSSSLLKFLLANQNFSVDCLCKLESLDLLPNLMGVSFMGLITESYPETMNPYRIIPLITESYPYTKIWGMIR